VTVIVKAFERPCCIARFVRSVRRHYPRIAVLVCDDSREPLFGDGEAPAPGVTWLTLPFEAGHTLGAGRNHLVARTRTPWFFLADDDHVVTPHTRLDEMHRVASALGYELVGGTQGRGDYGTAVFEEVDGIVYQRFFRHRGALLPGVVRCDRVSNTFLARTEAAVRVPWEPRVKAQEHAEFFLRAWRAGLKVAQVGYCYVDHNRDCEPPTGLWGRMLGRVIGHRDLRYHALMVDARGLFGRRSDEQHEAYRRYCLEKNGIRGIVDEGAARDRRALEAEIGAPFYGRTP